MILNAIIMHRVAKAYEKATGGSGYSGGGGDYDSRSNIAANIIAFSIFSLLFVGLPIKVHYEQLSHKERVDTLRREDPVGVLLNKHKDIPNSSGNVEILKSLTPEQREELLKLSFSRDKQNFVYFRDTSGILKTGLVKVEELTLLVDKFYPGVTVTQVAELKTPEVTYKRAGNRAEKEDPHVVIFECKANELQPKP